MPQEVCPNYPPADAPDNEPYACFLQRKDQIAAWLRAGYSVKGVWATCQRASPAFEASYQTFWRYCRQHGLSVPRGTPPAVLTKSPSEGPKAPNESPAPGSSPKVWPRLRGKPPEFIPRTED